MATHKVTWFFEGRERGWTESLFYVTGLGHQQTLEHAKILAIRRVDLLGVECKIKATRVSTEGSGPDALLDYEEFKPGSQEPAAHPDIGVLIRCNNVDDHRWKHIFLRGVWDRIEDNNGDYKRKFKPWVPLMSAYLAELKNGNWCWMGVENTPKVKVTGYTVGADDRITYNFAGDVFPDALVGKNSHVRISGVNGKSRANGLFPVEVITKSSATTVKPHAVGAYRFGGFGVYSTLTPIGIAKAVDQKCCERKAGAPLLESPGRAKAKPAA
jgi:hypothetical protein